MGSRIKLHDVSHMVITVFFEALARGLQATGVQIDRDPIAVRELIANVITEQRQMPREDVPDTVRAWLQEFHDGDYETLLTQGHMVDNVGAILHLLAHHFRVNFRVVYIAGIDVMQPLNIGAPRTTMLRYDATGMHYDAITVAMEPIVPIVQPLEIQGLASLLEEEYETPTTVTGRSFGSDMSSAATPTALQRAALASQDLGALLENTDVIGDSTPARDSE